MSVTVSEIAYNARARTGKTNSTFISDTTDIIPWADEAHRELYELLVTTYGDEYFMLQSDKAVAADAQKTSITTLLSTASGVGDALPEPTSRVPWKIVRVDVAFDSVRVPMSQFTFADAILSDTSQTWSHSADLRYRWVQHDLWWHPRPSTAQTVRIYYVPVCYDLTAITDTVEPLCEPWVEYLTVTLCLKIAQKERDSEAIKAFMAEKADVRQRVILSAPARDIGQPQTIADVRTEESPYFDRWY